MDPIQEENDQPTGALNRRAFNERVEEALAAAQPFALCLRDLDRFKQINDQHRHDSGDAVLCEVVTRLRVALWADDVIGRFGGDKFTVLLMGANQERSRRAAEKMRRSVSQLMEVGGANITSVVSIAIAIYPDHGTTVEALVRYADQELARVKGGRRGLIQRLCRGLMDAMT